MYAIKRAINGISINGDEWLLNPDGSTMMFNTEGDAWRFLRNNTTDFFLCDVVQCEPDGVTKEIKPYPTIWGYDRNAYGDVYKIEVMVPVIGDHPCLLTLESHVQIKGPPDWTITSEGYD